MNITNFYISLTMIHILAKLETLTEDSDFIAAAANITKSLPWHNKQMAKNTKVV